MAETSQVKCKGTDCEAINGVGHSDACEAEHDYITSYNVGASDYATRRIQPWHIWEEYNLNPWDADIVKRILRNKSTDSRELDYEKIIHICKYRLEMLRRE